MEFIWNRLYVRFEGMKIYYDGKLWVLCDIRIFCMYFGRKSLDFGFLKCSLMLGKLNFVLGYLLVLLIVLFVG